MASSANKSSLKFLSTRALLLRIQEYLYRKFKNTRPDIFTKAMLAASASSSGIEIRLDNHTVGLSKRA